ncbi:DUF2971 domain-containing protein [Devosia sp. A449]
MLKRELDTLKNSYLYAPAFGSMNDPMEAFYETGGPGDRIVDAMLGHAGNASRQLYKLLDDMIAKFALVSFSSSPDDLPLWAYYAGNFAGVCLEFDSAALTISDFQGEKLFPVKYARNALPPISLADLGQDKMQEAVLARITRKRTEWQHEKEWRYVTGSVGPKHYVDDALKRVYLGPRISKTHADAVVETLRSRPVEILQGEISGFELRFRTVKEATPIDQCERVGDQGFDRAGALYAEKELREFLSVPFEDLVAECERIAARPNFDEFGGIDIAGSDGQYIYLWVTHKLRNGRKVYEKMYFDRKLQRQRR